MKVTYQSRHMQVVEQKVSGYLFTFKFTLVQERLPWCWSCEAWQSGKPALGTWICHGTTKAEAERGCIKAIQQSLRAARMTIPR